MQADTRIEADIAGRRELPVEGVSPRNIRLPGDSALITYRVRLDVPRELVLFVSRLLARRRKEAGTRKGTRNLGCYRQALFVMAWYLDKTGHPAAGRRVRAVAGDVVPLRCGGLGGDFGAGTRAGGSAGTRREGGGAVCDPGRRDRLRRPVPREDRQPEGPRNRPVVLGEEEGLRREHPVPVYPGGLPAWISDVLPGNVHDLAAPRDNVLPVLRNYTGRLPVLAYVRA
jgi:hypothetical protein